MKSNNTIARDPSQKVHQLHITVTSSRLSAAQQHRFEIYETASQETLVFPPFSSIPDADCNHVFQSMSVSISMLVPMSSDTPLP